MIEKILEVLSAKEKLHENMANDKTGVLSVMDKCSHVHYAECFKEAKEIVQEVAEEYKTCYKGCTGCEAYDMEKHYCPKWCDVIKSTVEEIEADKNNGWISVEERLPKDSNFVWIRLGYTYSSMFAGYGVARLIKFDNRESYWCDTKYGYLEWDRYSDGRGGTSSYKVLSWMPITPYQKGE